MTGSTGSRPFALLVVSRCSRAFGPSRGGVDVLAERHAIVLAKDDRVVFVGAEAIDHPSIRTLIVRPGDLIRSDGRGFAYLLNEAYHVVRASLAGLKWEQREPVDLVVSNSSISTILLKALGRRPVVHYIHDALYEAGRANSASGVRRLTGYLLNGLIESWAIRVADRVICPSNGIAAQARSTGARAQKVSVLYPFVPAQRAASDSVPAAATTLPSAIDGADPYLLTVGQQTGRKRFDVVLRALKLLPARYRLVIVGDGPVHPGYPPLARELGVADRVLFLPRVADEVLDALYQRCAVYVLASENEGFPITIAEALLHGRPAILACPAIDPVDGPQPAECLVLIPRLGEASIAAAVRQLVERAVPDPLTSRRSIREWALGAFPSEEQVRREYDRIIRALV